MRLSFVRLEVRSASRRSTWRVTVGQDKTPSPWGTYDQGAATQGATSSRSWTRSHRNPPVTTSSASGADSTGRR
jgi:hypothetical protein